MVFSKKIKRQTIWMQYRYIRNWSIPHDKYFNEDKDMYGDSRLEYEKNYGYTHQTYVCLWDLSMNRYSIIQVIIKN